MAQRCERRAMRPTPEMEVKEMAETTDPLSVASEVSRFWTLVLRAGADECWLWSGYAEEGYGKFPWMGQMTGTHELALAFTIGEARPSGMDTCHSCHHSLCCNPRHLRFDTRRSNVDDSMRAGRLGKKLTLPDVIEIRERLATGRSVKALAAAFGVSRNTIADVGTGKTWPSAPGPLTTRAAHRPRKANYTPPEAGV